MAKYSISLRADEFRRALSSALLICSLDPSEVLSRVCLHMEDDGKSITVNGMNQHCFYQERLDLLEEKDVFYRLPEPKFGASRGQLLLPRDAVQELIKLLPKNSRSYVSLEVYQEDSEEEETRKQRVEVSITGGVHQNFCTIALPYPDYSLCLSTALANRNSDPPQVSNRRVFDSSTLLRVVKALRGEVCQFYFGRSFNEPCLATVGDNVRIVFMSCYDSADDMFE